MFEAKLSEGVILKKIVDSIKDIVTDVNIDISPSGKCPACPSSLACVPKAKGVKRLHAQQWRLIGLAQQNEATYIFCHWKC